MRRRALRGFWLGGGPECVIHSTFKIAPDVLRTVLCNSVAAVFIMAPDRNEDDKKVNNEISATTNEGIVNDWDTEEGPLRRKYDRSPPTDSLSIANDPESTSSSSPSSASPSSPSKLTA